MQQLTTQLACLKTTEQNSLDIAVIFLDFELSLCCHVVSLKRKLCLTLAFSALVNQWVKQET